MKKKIICKIVYVCIFVCDIDVMVEWYGCVFGFEKVFNFIWDGWVFGYYFDVGGDMYIEVFENVEVEYLKCNQINYICFEVVNMDEVIVYICDCGVEVSVKLYGCDDIWQSWIIDLNGVCIEFFEYMLKSVQFMGGDWVVYW